MWQADIPERGEYAVYVSYESTPESADDAYYTVRHLGGETSFAVNQTMGGGTWIYLGRFPFAAGRQEVVTLSNRSRTGGRIVSADAVKIGGGYGNVARTSCDSLRLPGAEHAGETSGYPRFCEGARYWLQWAGFPEEVYTPKNNTDDYKDDYMSRAHWVNALMGGSERLPDSAGLRIPVDMALAFHSDAGVRDGDGIIGTLGIFFTRENKGKFQGGADRYRSRDLTDLVQTQIVEDIRRTCEPAWSRRGMWNRAYYEARVPGVPTMLLELLSHQNFADMRLGHDPRFKFLVSRAVYKGILRYVSSQYDLPYVVQPLPVEAFAAEFAAAGEVALSWSPAMDPLEATAAPTGYVVYTRVDDGGFDNGRYVDKPRLTVRQEPGRMYSYRVTAVNEGGESFPSETLAACRVPRRKGLRADRQRVRPRERPAERTERFAGRIPHGPRRRRCGPAGHRLHRSAARLRPRAGPLQRRQRRPRGLRVRLGDRRDRRQYVRLSGPARAFRRGGGLLVLLGVGRAVERGEVSLEAYPAVDLILGKQRTTPLGRGVCEAAFRTFPPELQAVLRRYLAGGGGLFASGSYVAADLWAEGTPEEGRAFAREVLRIDSDGGHPSDRGRVRVMTSDASFSRGEYRFNTEYRRDRYVVERADALKPAGAGAFAVMRYDDSGRTAAVACDAGGRTFVAGFPFESIPDGVQRDRLMRDVLRFLFSDK